MSIREVLNARRWHRGDLNEVDIEIVHRGAPGDRRVIPGWSILDIQPNGFLVDRFKAGETMHDADLEPTSFIPYHRVTAIRHADDVLWSKP